MAELDSTGAVVSRFVYATRVNVPDYLVKNDTTYRLVLDHLGSVRLVVNTSNDSVVQRLHYDEFGVVTLNTNPGFQPFGFAGGLYDQQTGLVRFGVRDYDAGPGRWTSRDPIGFLGGDGNLYAYVDSDPVNNVDEEGLVAPIVAGAVAVGVRLAATPFARALIAAGLASPLVQRGLYHAHHIVARASPYAQQARAVLARYGVQVRDAVNGVFLPAAQHVRLHTLEYYRRVNELLRAARSREDVLRILAYIRDRLSQGRQFLILPFWSLDCE